MKSRMLRCIAVMLVIIMALPVLPSGVAKAATAKPTLSTTAKTIVGTDATFTVNLINAGSNIKRMTWYTLNDKVAIVEKTADPMTAKITTIGKGTTYVKCKITYKDGTVARPYCKVTVRIAATGIEINNALDDVLNNNRHVIAVGEKYNFNRDIEPANASDKTYWVLDNGDSGTEYASVVPNGTVTGLKPGFVTLTAVASLTKEGVATSKVYDTINIEIVPKTLGVKDVKLVDTTTLRITFDEPINPATVIGANGKLLDSVVITPKTDVKNKTANALGNLTASLSTDGKILTILSQYNFDGLYGLHLTTSVKGTDGVPLEEYFENLELYDKTAPSFKDYTLDKTGLIVTINFTEAMDFTAMDIVNARVYESGKTMLTATAAFLSQETNYKVSTDKKSLTIDLTNMSVDDRNKLFEIELSNIKDLAGNYPAQYPLKVYFRTDTTPQSQAKLLTLTRTGYTTLTAVYDRPIKTAGTLSINNLDYPQGVVDVNDATKVNYTLTSYSTQLTGYQNVSIGYWDSYNVPITDTSARQMFTRLVDFTVDKTAPALISNTFTQETISGVVTNVLTLTYNKAVTLVADAGTFTAKLVTTNNDMYSNKAINYTAYADGAKVIVYIATNQMTDSGVYTVTLPAGFVKDQYTNLSTATSVNLVKSATVAGPLPAPKSIAQTADFSVIEVKFDQKVDAASAQNLTNYRIAGVNILSAVLTDNTDAGARILLTVQSGSIAATTIYPITIKGIKGFNNTYAEMDEYTLAVPLTENKAPALSGYTYSYPSTIILTFSEALTGTPAFQVMQGTTNLGASSVINGNTVVITLTTVPALGGAQMQITPTSSNLIKDAAGNAAIVYTFYLPASH